MKAISIAILFCASLAFGEDTNITSKVFEKRDKDGNVTVRVERVFRGKEDIVHTMSRTNKEGALAVTARVYYLDGDLVMSESDEDGDGFLEEVTIHHPGRTNEMEVFTRQTDGSVNPVTTKTLEAYKKQKAAESELLEKVSHAIFEKDGSFEQIEEAIQDARPKIQAAEKEKSDGAK